MAPDVAGAHARSAVHGERGGEEWSPAVAALARLRRWGGEELVAEMAGIFLADMPRRLAAARAALAAGDRAGVALPAHAMKSSSAQLGAAALERLCAAAEALAQRGDLAGVAPLLDAAAAELARISAWLTGEAGGSAGRGEAP